ncbi:MAG: hypothetical protein Q7V31_09085 [Parvibaculum sp.]|uniref:hypothetical protein n=1 Tax=Parvibaculum sp. TaxID=2024848 RepID=UPI0027217C00|nr:hypothetical protein [Parvibaculum sp.]MDO8839073.1 hypothetical protein [Parvibaculum sp.]
MRSVSNEHVRIHQVMASKTRYCITDPATGIANIAAELGGSKFASGAITGAFA